jgi:glycosyltransferase involved in cell wall biosynthesis
LSTSKKRILLHDRTGVPFTVQLGRELAQRGHEVLFSYAAFFQSPKGNLTQQPTDVSNFHIEAMELSKPFQKYSFIKRRFQEIEYAHDLVDQIKRFMPDVLILAGSHPDALSVVYKECQHLDMKIVFWLQDVYGIAIKRILRKRMPIIGDLIGNYYIWQEKRLLRQSDDVILITDDFMGLMDEWGVAEAKRHVIQNWTPLEELPVRSKNNAWSMSHELSDRFCFLYAGTLGLKHNPDLLLQLAVHFQDDSRIKIVVISEGLGADWLKKKKQEYNLPNLEILDFQPFEQFPEVLGSADVLLAILEPDAGVYSAPSKVLTYLCAERPLLAAIPAENLSARIIEQNKAGIVVSPSNTSAFLAAADKLLHDQAYRESLGKNARLYAEENFNIKRIGDQFEQIF